MPAKTLETTDYLKLFEASIKGSKDPTWISALRKEAFASFRELGFPTREHEDWRYTNLAPVAEADWQLESGLCQDQIQIQKLQLGDPEWHRLVFVNGNFSPTLSSVSKFPAGVKAGSLCEALKSDSIIAEQYIGKFADHKNEALVALNTAFIHDGAFIFIPKGIEIDKPIHLLFVSHDTGKELIAQTRNLIVAGELSKAVIVESYISLEDHRYFNNSVTEVALGPGSNVDLYKDEKESINAFHIDTTRVSVDRNASFNSTSIALGADLSRSGLHVALDAPGAFCDLKGIYFVTGKQHVDNHLFVDHRKPNGTSKQLYKGILDGRSSGVFSGKIFIRKDAQKTDAEQTNKNLLLSEFAKVDTKPQLEIFADDVKATHGAAIGQLNEEEVFYLKSRGIGDQNARGLLTFGFASELVEKIKLNPIRWELDRIFWTRLQERPR